MNFFIKTFVILIIVSVSESCFITDKRNNIQKINNKNLSSWVVRINAKDENRLSPNSDIYYGSLIHPQAVLTSNELPLIAQSKNFHCFAGCPSEIDRPESVNKCQHTRVSNTYSRGLNVILILEEPFAINDNTNVIKLVKNKDLILDSNCYFYAETLNFFNNGSTTISIQDSLKSVSIAASYKTKFTNGTIGPYIDHNGNFTQVVDSSLSIDDGRMILKAHFASPIVCQLRDDPSGYGQIGFFSFNQTIRVKTNGVSDSCNSNQTHCSYISLDEKNVLKIQNLYRDIAAVRDDIYYILINHFNLTSTVESLYNRVYAFEKIDPLK